MDHLPETPVEMKSQEPEHHDNQRRDATSTLRHIEKLLAEIRGALDASARDDEHRHFSTVKTVGAILQVIVGGLLALALLDWILGAETDSLMIKLAFAAVLQLCALTAFVVAGRIQS